MVATPVPWYGMPLGSWTTREWRGQVKSMNALISFYKTFQQQLAWLGGNFNQSMHRANELAIAGELSPDYFSNILLPKTKEAISIVRQLKSELDKVHSQIENKQ